MNQSPTARKVIVELRDSQSDQLAWRVSLNRRAHILWGSLAHANWWVSSEMTSWICRSQLQRDIADFLTKRSGVMRCTCRKVYRNCYARGEDTFSCRILRRLRAKNKNRSTQGSTSKTRRKNCTGVKKQLRDRATRSSIISREPVASQNLLTCAHTLHAQKVSPIQSVMLAFVQR